jgi:hypothetical protein
MVRRRLIPLSTLALFVGVAWWWRRRNGDRPAPVDLGAATPDPVVTSPSEAAWVAPVGGACPDGYPVKANDTSGIFHLPGGRFYDRTAPTRCYASADAAEADGYRRAKA